MHLRQLTLELILTTKSSFGRQMQVSYCLVSVGRANLANLARYYARVHMPIQILNYWRQ